jgi:hypothetical protein
MSQVLIIQADIFYPSEYGVLSINILLSHGSTKAPARDVSWSFKTTLTPFSQVFTIVFVILDLSGVSLHAHKTNFDQ